MNLSLLGKAANAVLFGTTLLFSFSNTFAGDQSAKRTSMFNERWLDAVVSLEQLKQQLQSDGTAIFLLSPTGTGFIVETQGKHLVLVTAKHVVTELITTETGSPELKARKGLRYRLNQKEGPAYLIDDQELQTKGLGPWFFATNNDVAIRFLQWKETAKFAVITQADFIQRADLQVGANLLVLGFPLGLRSPEHPNPIARKGMVAQSDRDALIADAFIFPGNSGGPVIYTPPIKVGGAMTSPFINDERLAGLAISYQPYRETAESTQTRKSRIIFEENSGLANIEPADKILELLERADVKAFEASIANR